jgi:hypothetical protein
MYGPMGFWSLTSMPVFFLNYGHGSICRPEHYLHLPLPLRIGRVREAGTLYGRHGLPCGSFYMFELQKGTRLPFKRLYEKLYPAGTVLKFEQTIILVDRKV